MITWNFWNIINSLQTVKVAIKYNKLRRSSHPNPSQIWKLFRKKKLSFFTSRIQWNKIGIEYKAVVLKYWMWTVVNAKTLYGTPDRYLLSLSPPCGTEKHSSSVALKTDDDDCCCSYCHYYYHANYKVRRDRMSSETHFLLKIKKKIMFHIKNRNEYEKSFRTKRH